MSLSAIFILNIDGKILISRDYKGNIDFDQATNLVKNLLWVVQFEDEIISPIIETKSNLSFAFIKIKDLYIACAMKKNVNITLVFSFMWKFIKLLTDYLRELEEESIKDNYIIIHELLDEIMDYGYPQVMDAKILQKYITQNSYKLQKNNAKLPTVITNAVSWRLEDIKYRKNEVFIDVIESIDLLVNMNGTVLKNDVIGCVKMNVKLSGMPLLKLGLSDKIILDFESVFKESSLNFEDINFHHCVQLSKVNEKAICFIPPDGEFKLMSYRVNTDIKPLISVQSRIIKYPHSRIEYIIKTNAQFKKSCNANNVEFKIPIVDDVDSPKITTTLGSAEYDAGKSAIIWRIKYFAGGTEQLLNANFKLSSIGGENANKKIPIEVKFVIPYFTVTGFQIKFIKIVEKGNYKALTWIKYTTQNGDYFIRI